jgi:hypothetical protein
MSAAVLRAYVASATAPTQVPQRVALDSKAHRARLCFPSAGCPIHALSAVCHGSGLVLAHAPITKRGDMPRPN